MVSNGTPFGWSSNNDVTLGGQPDTTITRTGIGILGVGGPGTLGNTGGTLTAAKVVVNTTLSPTSTSGGGTAGITGQIAWDGAFIYICSVGGIAGSATWLKAALVASV
jgi:hypothetical protein